MLRTLWVVVDVTGTLLCPIPAFFGISGFEYMGSTTRSLVNIRVLHTSLNLTSGCCRYQYIVWNLVISTNTTSRRDMILCCWKGYSKHRYTAYRCKFSSLHFVTYTLFRKMLQIQVTHLRK